MPLAIKLSDFELRTSEIAFAPDFFSGIILICRLKIHDLEMPYFPKNVKLFPICLFLFIFSFILCNATTTTLNQKTKFYCKIDDIPKSDPNCPQCKSAKKGESFLTVTKIKALFTIYTRRASQLALREAFFVQQIKFRFARVQILSTRFEFHLSAGKIATQSIIQRVDREREKELADKEGHWDSPRK